MKVSTLIKQKQLEISGMIELIEDEIIPALSDCKDQADTLKEWQDVSWDCYDIRNWSSMVDCLERAMKVLSKLKKLKL